VRVFNVKERGLCQANGVELARYHAQNKHGFFYSYGSALLTAPSSRAAARARRKMASCAIVVGFLLLDALRSSGGPPLPVRATRGPRRRGPRPTTSEAEGGGGARLRCALLLETGYAPPAHVNPAAVPYSAI
jgi:hypothetical protein